MNGTDRKALEEAYLLAFHKRSHNGTLGVDERISFQMFKAGVEYALSHRQGWGQDDIDKAHEKIEVYTHHRVVVSVQRALKGKHRDHCLCFQGCKWFKPNTLENCPIAQALYEFDVRHGAVTPMWECSKFSR